MPNNFFASKLNPTKFTVMNFVNIPQYISKFMDLYLFEDTIERHEEPVNFCQPWTSTDPVRNQFVSNYGPMFLKIWTVKYGEQISLFTQEISPALPDADRVGYNVYNMDYDLAPFAALPGCYYFTIDCGGGQLILVSEPFEIGSGIETILLEYSHPKPYEGIIFKKSNGQDFFTPALRVPGRLKYEGVEYVDTLYYDQTHNATISKSVPFDAYTFILGRSPGVPPWLMKKVGRIFGCENVKSDGLLIVKATENQNWEKTDQEEYPMFGYKLKVVEKLNHASLSYETNTPIVGLNSVAAIVETKGFGFFDQGGNFLEIESTQ